MEDDGPRGLSRLGGVWALGISMPLSIMLGLGAGLGLDRLFGTRPILTLVFLLLGIVAAFVTLIRETKRVE
jgi:ATP synthase protein I